MPIAHRLSPIAFAKLVERPIVHLRVANKWQTGICFSKLTTQAERLI